MNNGGPLSIDTCFSYDLPDNFIAQRPIFPPAAARLLVDQNTDNLPKDLTFKDLPGLLTNKDLLIFNNSKVIPVRLFGELESGRKVEIFLVREVRKDCWIAMGKPLKVLRSGVVVKIYGDLLDVRVVERSGEMEVVVELFSKTEQSVVELLNHVGTMPIPPYIRDGMGDDQDKLDYQTIFAKNSGSIAAPTASLHFDPELIAKIDEVGVSRAEVTLHVGVASVLPLWRPGQGKEELTPPAGERCVVPEKTISEIAACRARGGRVIAVGTTVVRALESVAQNNVLVGDNSSDKETELFITPGHIFRNVDVMITNFHQPRSTHLLLVEAFIGRPRLSKIYNHGLSHGYRFLSYGDGMILFR